jgi:uncharacterized protein HemY
MSWVVLLSVLVAWLAIGLAVAYLFGRFIRGVETTESSELIPVVSYLRRNKRAKAATQTRVVLPQARARREPATRH